MTSDPVSRQSVEISVRVGERDLGRYVVKGPHLFYEFACVGVTCANKLQDESAQDIAAEPQGDGQVVQSDNRGPILNGQRQPVIEAVDEHVPKLQNITWDKIKWKWRAMLIVWDGKLNPKEKLHLEHEFPGVVVWHETDTGEMLPEPYHAREFTVDTPQRSSKKRKHHKIGGSGRSTLNLQSGCRPDCDGNKETRSILSSDAQHANLVGSNSEAAVSETQTTNTGPAVAECDEALTGAQGHITVPLIRAEALYKHWCSKRNIPVVSTPRGLPRPTSTVYPKGSTNGVYEDLLDLFIYAQNNETKSEFQDAVLLKWQEIEVSTWNGKVSVPHLDIIDKAFRSLSKHNILLEYLVRSLGLLWSTDEMESMEKYQPRGSGFERFLYGISWHRSVVPLGFLLCSVLTYAGRAFNMKRLVNPVLCRPCEFHHHATKEEEQKCYEKKHSLVVNYRRREWKKDLSPLMESNVNLRSLAAMRLLVESEEEDEESSVLSGSPASIDRNGRAQDKHQSEEIGMPDQIVAVEHSDDELYRDLTPDPQDNTRKEGEASGSPLKTPNGRKRRKSMDRASWSSWRPSSSSSDLSSAVSMEPVSDLDDARHDTSNVASAENNTYIADHGEASSSRKRKRAPTTKATPECASTDCKQLMRKEMSYKGLIHCEDCRKRKRGGRSK
jgi:hypothetical protein